MAKVRATRIFRPEDALEERVTESSYGPIRIVRFGARWRVCAMNLGKAIGLAEWDNPYKCFENDLSENRLSDLYQFKGEAKPTSVLVFKDVYRILTKKGVRSTRKERAATLLKKWYYPLERELKQERRERYVRNTETPAQTETLPVPAQTAQTESVQALPEITLTVENIGGQTGPATTSLKVAEYFEKEHFHVIRDIRETIAKCSESFNASNFGLVAYADAKGEERSMYVLSKDGFLMLAMSYTSPKAMRIKERYIAAFNAMEKHIKEHAGFDMPRSLPEALRAYADEVEAHAQTKLALVETEQRAARAEAERDFEVEARKLDAPKVLFAKSVEMGGVNMDVDTFSATYHSQSGQPMGRNRMFALFVRHNLADCVDCGNGITYYKPKGEAKQKGWLILVPGTVKKGNRVFSRPKLIVTPVGQIQITSRFLKELESMGFYNSNLRNM
ncbi:hypothetical protein B5F76_09110 [Desulfovibrio sp. An276]|uniref:Rha family transcriptional regulator n=1 Tax=Desulfovibrio sp. An276 TaxID=1965618 RepID=UPI000B37509C|nr:Rha family transcriptional regulator [Desulfovibrio sp. An276]OUO51632.1 hypothetical protein B5F76_09110 [Desulfovibrio sp. An276]